MDLGALIGAAPARKYKNSAKEREQMRMKQRRVRAKRRLALARAEEQRRLVEARAEQQRTATVRRSVRPAAAAAKERIEELLGNADGKSDPSNDGIAAGFAQCVKGKTNRRIQERLCGAFFRWLPNGIDRTARNVGLCSDASKMMENGQLPTGVKKFTCHLNRSYGQSKQDTWQATWIPWVAVLPLHGRGYGVFASREFRANDVVGVYMGLPCSKKDNMSSHLENPYVLRGVANAGGGVDSGFPALLGMHFMNHAASDDSRCNVFVVGETGAVIASKCIRIGTELCFDYGNRMSFSQCTP